MPQPPAPYYYRQVDPDVFESTLATQSPWDFSAQHGGPPTALLVRAVERESADDSMRIARISTDFLGPIPQGICRVSTRTVRPGRRVRLVESVLEVGDRPAVVLRAWLINREPGRVAEIVTEPPAPAVPGPQLQRYFPGIDPSWGYGRSIEWRAVSGGFDEPGPAKIWARLQVDVVEGEQATGMQRLAVIADSANGISAAIDEPGWLYIPPGLTVTVMREPTSEWIYLDAKSQAATDGIGVTHAVAYDEAAFLGYVTQPLLIAPA